MIEDAISFEPARELIAAHDAVGAIPRDRTPTDHAAAGGYAVCATGEDFALMMAQYLESKAKNPDHVLFFRVADFYVHFFEDAEIGSRVMGTALKRGEHLGKDFPICGVSLKAANDYLQRLVGAGYCVAVCEGVESLAEARKNGGIFVVRRDIVRLVRPIGRRAGLSPAARPERAISSISDVGGKQPGWVAKRRP